MAVIWPAIYCRAHRHITNFHMLWVRQVFLLFYISAVEGGARLGTCPFSSNVYSPTCGTGSMIMLSTVPWLPPLMVSWPRMGSGRPHSSCGCLLLWAMAWGAPIWEQMSGYGWMDGWMEGFVRMWDQWHKSKTSRQSQLQPSLFEGWLARCASHFILFMSIKLCVTIFTSLNSKEMPNFHVLYYSAK